MSSILRKHWMFPVFLERGVWSYLKDEFSEDVDVEKKFEEILEMPLEKRKELFKEAEVAIYQLLSNYRTLKKDFGL